jgi:bifunctional DNase/RNase
MIEVTVDHVELDQNSQSPKVVLQEKNGQRVLEIWIGPAEASAIAMELAGVKFVRPLTHDLLRQVILGLGAQLKRVVITKVQDNTYYAALEIRRDDHVIQIDARPSDSIAIAMRLGAPIYTNEGLLDAAVGPGFIQAAPDPALESDDLKKHLQDLDPEDFGKFTP